MIYFYSYPHISDEFVCILRAKTCHLLLITFPKIYLACGRYLINIFKFTAYDKCVSPGPPEIFLNLRSAYPVGANKLQADSFCRHMLFL